MPLDFKWFFYCTVRTCAYGKSGSWTGLTKAGFSINLDPFFFFITEILAGHNLSWLVTERGLIVFVVKDKFDPFFQKLAQVPDALMKWLRRTSVSRVMVQPCLYTGFIAAGLRRRSISTPLHHPSFEIDVITLCNQLERCRKYISRCGVVCKWYWGSWMTVMVQTLWLDLRFL